VKKSHPHTHERMQKSYPKATTHPPERGVDLKAEQGRKTKSSRWNLLGRCVCVSSLLSFCLPQTLLISKSGSVLGGGGGSLQVHTHTYNYTERDRGKTEKVLKGIHGADKTWSSFILRWGPPASECAVAFYCWALNTSIASIRAREETCGNCLSLGAHAFADCARCTSRRPLSLNFPPPYTRNVKSSYHC
jgi:hypothetical protein